MIPCYEQFVKSLNLAVFLHENLCDVSLRKHRCVKIGVGLNNCCWGQVVTGTWTLLLCILGLRDTKDKNFLLFPLKFSVLLFSYRRVMGFILCTHHSVWRAKNALQLRYTWFPAMSDLLRFEIWQVFLLENLCDVCLWKHRWVKIGVGLPNCSWGQVVTGAGVLLSCVLGLCYTKDINFIFFSPEIFSSSIFTSTSNGVSYFALINRFGGLKMRCSWDIRDSLLWATC